MIPRTVRMAAEVAAQLTNTQLEQYGNIVLNGYATTGPNTTGKLAWQYKETAGAPVPLPNVVSVQPMLRGWTTNYYEYYTQLQPNGYGVNPGDPTMFEHTVHSFTPQTGAIDTFGWISPGSGYAAGTYLAEPLNGGTGSGATADIIVTEDTSIDLGPARAVSFVSAGGGYSGVNQFFSGRKTVTLTGSGVELTVVGNSNNNVLVNVSGVSNGGSGYRVGDTFQVLPGTGVGQVDAVGYGGVVTSFTLVSPGTGYTAGDSLTAFGLPDGSGFYAPVATIVPDAATGGAGNWSQAPRRFNQNQVSDSFPPDDNQQAIQYSFIYPVADNPAPPPTGTL